MHIMIDIETLGLDPASAPILQIGAAAFELDGDGPAAGIPLFTANANVASNLQHPFHRSIEPGTVAFWADTDPELLVEIMRGHGSSLTHVLAELGIWFTRVDTVIEGVWSNGPCFDIAMLEAAYNQDGMRVPWTYRMIRDVRTMAMIAGDHDPCWTQGTITEIEREGRKHEALVDVLRQIRMVQQTWQRRVMPMPVVEVLNEMSGQGAG